MLQTVLAALVLGGVGFLLGYLVLPAPCEADSPERIARLKEKLQNLRLHAHQLESLPVAFWDLQKEPPLPWPEDIPPQYRPERFQKIVKQALEEIQAPVDLVGFECREYPCIAKLRIREGYISRIQLSAAWQENFGKGITGSPVTVDCPDGHQEPIELIAAEWNGRHDPRSMSPEAYKRAMQQEAKRLIRGRITEKEARRGRRLSLRLRVSRLFWECAR